MLAEAASYNHLKRDFSANQWGDLVQPTLNVRVSTLLKEELDYFEWTSC